MIKAKLGDSGLLIGLSAMNLQRLREGKPIAFDMSVLGLPAGPCVIMFGETEEAMAKQLADEGFLPAMSNARGSA